MGRSVEPEVNYSTILCDGMSKWRPKHFVEDFRFDVYSGFTRLTLLFRQELVSGGKIELGGREVVFDYDEKRLCVAWKDRQDRGWRFALSPEDGGQPVMDNMIGFLNYPLGGLATITQEHMDSAVSYTGPVPLPSAPHLSLTAGHLEAVVGHPDVSTFLFTRTTDGMSLDVKLSDSALLPVSRGEDGSRMVSFGFTPDVVTLSWGSGTGRVEERGWSLSEIGETAMERDVMPDLMGFAYRTITGEAMSDFRGKSSNPVWRIIRHLESCVSRHEGHVMPQAHG